jgi:hypothetical protein
MLPHVYAGTFLRRGTCVALAPLSALIVLTIPSIRNVDMALFIALCVVVGELLAHLSHRGRRNRYRVDAQLPGTWTWNETNDRAPARRVRSAW